MRGFYLGIVDVAKIDRLWNRVIKKTCPNKVLGIAASVRTLSEYMDETGVGCGEVLNTLTEWLSLNVARRTRRSPTIWVDLPAVLETEEDVFWFVNRILSYSHFDCRVGLNIPPFSFVWDMMYDLGRRIDLCVHGVTDAATALRCLSYREITGASLPIGSMEDAGINTKFCTQTIQQRAPDDKSVIAADIRTLEQLEWTTQYGILPVIGEDIWPLIETKHWFVDLFEHTATYERISDPSLDTVRALPEAEAAVRTEYFRQFSADSKKVQWLF